MTLVTHNSLVPKGVYGMGDDETRASDEQLAASNQGFQSSGDVRTGFISGATFERKAVQYEAVGDLAFFEGDICLGTVAALERSTGLVQASAAGDVSSDDPLI